MMTGAEYLNKARSIKTITDIRWQVNSDVLDSDEVKVIIIADGEEIKITYPLHPLNPQYDKEQEFFQNCAIALIVNKFMEQIGSDFRICHADDMAKAINNSRKKLKGGLNDGKHSSH